MFLIALLSLHETGNYGTINNQNPDHENTDSCLRFSGLPRFSDFVLAGRISLLLLQPFRGRCFFGVIPFCSVLFAAGFLLK